MKAQLVSAFLLFPLLKHKITYATKWSTQRYTEKDVYLQGFTIESSKVETIFACYTKCENNILCSSINLMLTDRTCELKYSTKSRHPEKKVNQPNTIYIEIRDDNDTKGSRPDIPTLSCKKLKENDNQAKSGVYWMKFNEPSSEPFQVFCDMTIDGGGWTLVYSYTFTEFVNFKSHENAVTPIPNWPVTWSPNIWVPKSMTTPVSESSHSAMDFALWKKIGNEFLIEPNVTNWVACVEGTGSLVNWKAGSVTCKVVKTITPKCTTKVPIYLVLKAPGVMLSSSRTSTLYSYAHFLWDGRKNYYFPTHDSCGTNSELNHVTNVTSPGGAIYIR